MAKCIRFKGKGGREVISVDDTYRSGDLSGSLVRVEVASSGLNRADILQRRGFYPAPEGTPQDIPGLEFAGTVAELGPGAARFSVGDKVMAIASGAAMASEVVSDESLLMPVPNGVDLVEAGGIPEAFVTAHDALEQAKAKAGDRVLIDAVGSGVGLAAMQIAQMLGCEVWGTTRTERKLELAKELGLKHGVIVKDGKLADALSGQTFNVILDFIGAAYADDMLRLCDIGAEWIMIGLLGGAQADIHLGRLLAKRVTLHGTVLRSRSLEEKAAASDAFARHLQAFGNTLRPITDKVFGYHQVADAHDYMESNQNFGKIIIDWTREVV